MPELHKREKVLVQYRLLRDFDELRRRGIPGIDVRVMEDNIYEWHVTMSPISGHFSGLRLHLVLLFPEDYPRHPPKVEICTYLPHANVFQNFLHFAAAYWAGYAPKRGSYVICTDLLADKPPPPDPTDPARYDGWSASYGVEAVLVQLQCLLFDDYVQSEDGHYINTLWDSWWSSPGQGRKERHHVCAQLHRAQKEADEFICRECGFSGRDERTAFYDKPREVPEEADDDGADEESSEPRDGASEDGEEIDEEGEEEAGAGGEPAGDAEAGGEQTRGADAGGEQAGGEDGPPKRTPRFVSRKKQRKRELEKLRVETANTKVDFKQQKLYMEISNSNSALASGRALRRVPGVFKERDVVSFHFHGVQDEAYVNGHRCINRNLDIFNYGHEVQYPWCTYDILSKRWIYYRTKPKEEKVEKVNKGKSSWEHFVNSQSGGGKLKPEDTPGTEAYVKQRERLYPAGVIENVDPYSCTVDIVVAGEDGKLGACGGRVTKYGRWAFNSEGWSDGIRATLYKNVPMEKVRLLGCEQGVVPYEHQPPVSYKPIPGRYVDDARLPYDLQKDMPVQVLKLLAAGGAGLTRQRLAALPEGGPLLPGSSPPASAEVGGGDSAPTRGPEVFRIGTPAASQSNGSSHAGGHSLKLSPGPGDPGDDVATENSFEIVSVQGDGASDAWEVLSEARAASAGSFDIISVVEERRSGSSQVSVSSSFHVVPTTLVYALNTPTSSAARSLASEVSEPGAAAGEGGSSLLESLSIGGGGGGGRAPSASGSEASSASSAYSSHSLLSLRNASISSGVSGISGGWQLLRALCRLNVPVRGFLKSTPEFGAFFSIDATPRDLVVQNCKLLPSSFLRPKGKGKGKAGKGKGRGESERLLEDGLLPCLPYMRPFWPPRAPGDEDANARRRASLSVMVTGNVLDDVAKQRDANSRDMAVYVNDVDVDRRRVKLSLQPRLTFDELQVGGEYEGIVVDASRQQTIGLFVALSDDIVGLLHKTQLGVGAYGEEVDENGWYKRSVYRVGDRVTVWVLRKAEAEAAAGAPQRQRFKIDLTMDSASAEVQQHQLRRFMRVLDEGAAQKHEAPPQTASARTAMDLQIQQTYDKEDRFFLLKNNRLIHQAEQQYPDLVIDYTTDPPPPPPVEEKERFDFSLIEGWSVNRITEEHKQLSDKKDAHDKASREAAGGKLPKDVKPLSKQEEKLLLVLQKKVEQWGKEYYERVTKKIEAHRAFVQDLQDKLKAERDKYPYKSVIDLDKFREMTERIKEKQYDRRSCFVTGLSYKEDVLGVGLEIVTEADTDRKVFQCSFDLLSKEAFYDFGVRMGVWKDRIQFWMPAAIDSSHFRRALPYLASCFKELGDGRVEKVTRSYGTQAGSAKYNLKAQLREVERSGQKIMSLDDYRRAEAARRAKARAPVPAPCSAAAAPPLPSPVHEPEGGAPAAEPIPSAGLTEDDVSFGLEVLPKLMNLQTVQLMKGDLHLSTKALEGYMGFHHLLLSILRQYPSLQLQVERKIGAFLQSEEARVKKACPNIGEFLCLLAVSKKYTWDDVSTAVLKETMDRNASWAIDKFPVLAGHGVSAETRIEKTFKASIVSIRLLCFNVWFLRNIVFKKYGDTATAASIVADKLQGGPKKNCVDLRWEEYEDRKGMPKPSEVDMLQEQMRSMMHGDGLNSWAEYFTNLNIKPLKGRELAQLLFMSLQDSVKKGYIPLWKLRPKPEKEKAPEANDYLGKELDKFS